MTIPLEVALAGMPGWTRRAASRCSGWRTSATSLTTASRSAGPAGSAQSSGLGQFRQRRPAADFADVADRRDLPLHAGKPAGHLRQGDLHPQRPEVAAGLDAAADVPPRRASPTSAATAARPNATRFIPTRRRCSATASRSSNCKTRSRPATPTSAATISSRATTCEVVRSLGLIGDGDDPVDQRAGHERPGRGRATTCGPRKQRRIREIRQIVLAVDQQRAGPRRRHRRRRTGRTTTT